MCQILKMSYNNGSIVVEVSSRSELSNNFFELYIFDFSKGEYATTANIKQAISSVHISPDSGIYRFKYSIPSNCRIKCIISDGEKVLASKERFIGDRYKISVDVETSEIGYIYKLRSDVAISKKLIFYKSPVSSTKIHLPDNLEEGKTLMFTIKDRSFRPRFESYPEFIECFNIE